MNPEAGGAGLATLGARAALILVWGTGVVQALLAGGLPVLAGPIGVLTCALPLVGVLLVTSRRPGPLPPARAAVVLAVVLLVALSVLAFLDIADRGAGEIWLFSVNSYLGALLIVRGNALVGAAAATGVVGMGLAWGIATGQSAEGLVGMLAPAVSAALVGTACLAVLLAATGREREARAGTIRADEEARAAEAVALLARAEADEILCLAREPLAALVAGRAIDGRFLRELTVAEGAIRDRIRAAGLAHPRLSEAVSAARGRGARVLLLGAEDPGGRPMSDALADALADVVDAAVDVTIQARAGGIVSVLARIADGPSVRILLDGEGQRVNGQIIGT